MGDLVGDLTQPAQPGAAQSSGHCLSYENRAVTLVRLINKGLLDEGKYLKALTIEYVNLCLRKELTNFHPWIPEIGQKAGQFV